MGVDDRISLGKIARVVMLGTDSNCTHADCPSARHVGAAQIADMNR